MVFSVKRRMAASFLIHMEFVPTAVQECPILLRRDAICLAFRTGAKSGKGIDVNLVLSDYIDQIRYLIDIAVRNRGHDDRLNSCFSEALEFFQCAIERAWFSEPVMCFTKAIQGHLILLASQICQPLTNGVIQMKRITHNGKRIVSSLQFRQKIPEIRMQDGISASNAEIRLTAKLTAHLLTIVNHF